MANSRSLLFLVLPFALLLSTMSIAAPDYYEPIASISAMVALGTSSSTIQHVHVIAYSSGGSSGSGDFDYTSSTITADGCVNFRPTGDTGTWVRETPDTSSISDSMCDTPADADAYAVAMAITHRVDIQESLSANTTYSAPRLYVAPGGSISRGSYNLTITGVLDGPTTQLLLPHGSGTLSITGGNVLYGEWFTGPWGNSSQDYQPGLQDAFNIVMSAGTTNGPRTLDLRANSSYYLTSGLPATIYLGSSISWPVDHTGGQILSGGNTWRMTPDNTPFFILNSKNGGQLWAYLAPAWDLFVWANPQTAAQTNSVVFQTHAVSGGLGVGEYEFNIQGIKLVGGWGIIATDSTSTVWNGWWNCHIQDLQWAGSAGSAIYHKPVVGGSAERQFYSGISSYQQASPTLPAIDIEQTDGVELTQFSIDGFGSTTATTVPAIKLSTSYNYTLRNGHIEASKIGFSGGFIEIDANSVGSIESLRAYNNTVSAGYNASLIYANTADSNTNINNVSLERSTIDSGSTFSAIDMNDTGANYMQLGRNFSIFVDAGYQTPAIINPVSVSGNQKIGQNVVVDGSTPLSFYYNALPTTQSETPMTGPYSGASTGGQEPDRTEYFGSLWYQIGSAITSGTITITVYSGGTLKKTYTLTSSSPANGFLEDQYGLYSTSTSDQFGAGGATVVKIASSGINTTKNVQVVLTLR